MKKGKTRKAEWWIMGILCVVILIGLMTFLRIVFKIEWSDLLRIHLPFSIIGVAIGYSTGIMIRNMFKSIKNVESADLLDKKNTDQAGYHYIQKIIFYPETLSPDYEEKAHAELAIVLDKDKFHHPYIKYEVELGICGYLAYGEDVHFINRYGMFEIENLFQTEDEIGKVVLSQANLWRDRFANEQDIRFVIEYVGKSKDFIGFL